MEPLAKATARMGPPLLLMAALLAGEPSWAGLDRASLCSDDKGVEMPADCMRINDISRSNGAGGTHAEADGATSVVPLVAPRATAEMYGDWGVECKLVEDNRTCSMVQTQIDPRRKVAFIMVVTPPLAGTSKAVLVMPFGVSLPEGVIIRIDGDEGELHVGFAACLLSGCIVQIELGQDRLDLMASGRLLKVLAVVFGNQETLNFDVSLKGFGAAIQRLQTIK